MAHPICHKVISVLFQNPIWGTNPVYNGVACFGEDLSNEHRLRQLELKWLIKTYETQQTKRSSSILFTKLAGTQNSNNKLKTESEADIRELGNRSRKVQKNES
jgi:hypothetical protein